MIFEFAENDHKIIVTAKHELILPSYSSDANIILKTFPNKLHKLKINKIE